MRGSDHNFLRESIFQLIRFDRIKGQKWLNDWGYTKKLPDQHELLCSSRDRNCYVMNESLSHSRRRSLAVAAILTEGIMLRYGCAEIPLPFTLATSSSESRKLGSKY